MPLMKRNLANILNTASGAGIFALLPLKAWAQNTPAMSGTSSYEQPLFFGIALTIVFIWSRVLISEYRHLCGQLDDNKVSLGRKDEYREMLNVSPDAVLISDDHRLRYANPAALKLFGAASFDVLAENRPIDLVDPEQLDAARALRQESLRTGRGSNYAIETLKHDDDGACVVNSFHAHVRHDHVVQTDQQACNSHFDSGGITSAADARASHIGI